MDDYYNNNKYRRGPEQEQSNRNKVTVVPYCTRNRKDEATLYQRGLCSRVSAWGKQKECLLLALRDNRAGLAAPNLSQQNTHETAEGKPVLLTAKQWMRQTEGQEIAL